MIRDAEPEDIPAMLGMAERFIEQAWARIGVPFCAESCTALLTALIEGGICMVSDDCRAMIGVTVHPWHFNRSVNTATELFWWAEPGCKAGKALREEAELRVRALGVPTINMACEHHMRSEALDRLYRMNGYRPSEHIYIKELC